MDIYVIKENNSFISIDYSSGGYPSNSNFYQATKFNKDHAHKYRDTMKKHDWELFQVFENENSITWNKVSWDYSIDRRK